MSYYQQTPTDTLWGFIDSKTPTVAGYPGDDTVSSIGGRRELSTDQGLEDTENYGDCGATTQR
jgi:hypothetical protein